MKTTSQKTQTAKSETAYEQVGNFRIEIDKLTFGWEYITLVFNETRIPFQASYIGNEPLYSLIEAVFSLDDKDNNFNNIKGMYAIKWYDEPGVLSMKLHHRRRTDKLSIDIVMNESASFGDRLKDGTEQIWYFEMEYKFFREAIIQIAVQMLNQHGFFGFNSNWDKGRYVFSLEKLLFIATKGKEPQFDKKLDTYKSDFSQELSLLLEKSFTIKEQRQA